MTIHLNPRVSLCMFDWNLWTQDPERLNLTSHGTV
eukprot:COSAG02_NODE_66830_length_254_cov_0.993548_2_plen_34_part_01